MLTNRTLARINNRPREVAACRSWPWAAGRWSWRRCCCVRVRDLALLRRPRRPRRRRAARPPALRDAEGQDDHLPLLQGQPGRRDRLPLLRGARSPGGPGLFGGDLEPARFVETAESGRGCPHSRAGSGEGRAAPHAGHQGRRADLGDRGRRREHSSSSRKGRSSTGTTATSRSRTTR